MGDDKKDKEKNIVTENGGQKEKPKKKMSAKARNTNLRLVKNGDRPVEKEKTSKPADPKPAETEDVTEKKEEKPKKEDKLKKEVNKQDKKVSKESSIQKGKKSGKKKKSKYIKKTKGKKKSSGKSSVRKEYYRNELRVEEWFVQNKSLLVIGLSIVVLLAVLAGIYYYIVTTYTVTTVYVDGNVHYNNEEVMEMVMGGRYGNNSLYLAFKYKDKGVEGVPFVEKMDVNILSPDTIRINVYEKALAGYVEYLGRYMYFDKDGIVVESSDIRTKGVPQVTGLTFSYVIIGEPLPVEKNEIFMKILSITQLLNKNTLAADKIFFDSAFDLTLYFENIKVPLGASEKLDEKIMKIKDILPKLDGKRGTLHLENYTNDTVNITFDEE